MGERITIKDLAESIDNLARMTANGFRGLEVRMDKLEVRVDRLDRRMDSFEVKLDTLSQRVDDLASGKVSRQEYLVLAGRVSVVEGQISASA